MPRFALIICSLLSFGVFGQIDEVRRITEQLCSPEFHGRGYYQKGDSLAADYLVSEFEKLGVSGYKKTELQHFTIDKVNVFDGTMEVYQNDVALVPGMHYVVDPSSAGYHGELNPLQVDAKTLMDIEKMRSIIQDIRSRRINENALALRLAGVGKDTLKELLGISQGLAQVVPVIEISDAKFTWGVGREQFPNVLLMIQDSIYDGGSLTLDIDAKEIHDYESQNVIGYVPAKKRTSKTILFTAHYDHLGRMGDAIYFPGANDNASGTAMLLTMASYFKDNPADYNIMFVAFAGEEAGLLGSEYFVEHPILKLKNIRFVINLDIMGSGEEGITAVNATLFEDEFKLLQEINEEKALLTRVKKRGPTANSDHYWFTEQGVPAFFIYTMGPNKHYHDIFDSYGELSFEAYDKITELLITFVSRLN